MQCALLGGVRILIRSNLFPLTVCQRMPVRYLMTKEELGVTQFEHFRKNARDQFADSTEVDAYKKNFKSNFETMSLDKQRDSLKQYIFLIDGSADEIFTLKSSLIEFQNKFVSSVHGVKEFIFGPQIMRLLYHLNLPDEAVKLFKDAETGFMFQTTETYRLLLNLLYVNKRYDEVVTLYKDIKKHLDTYQMHSHITMNCLALGACYHLNNAEHYEYAKSLWISIKNWKQLSRSKYFVAAMALKHDDPVLALNLIENSSYVIPRFIRLIAYTQLGQYDEACDLLSNLIRMCKSDRSTIKPCVGRQMVEDLQRSIERFGSKQQLNRFLYIYADLKSLDLLNDETLHEHLCRSFPPMLPKTLYYKMKNKTMKENIY